MSATMSAAEGPVTSETGQASSKRLVEIAEERQRWVFKRDEALVRKEKLLKLLQFQPSNTAKSTQSDTQKPENEGKATDKEGSGAMQTNGAAFLRKKELKELQVRAEAAREKQQMAASVLVNNLKQLQAKRKREARESDEHPRKKTAVKSSHVVEEAVAVSQMHFFATAPDLDVGTAKLGGAACFRIAMRHLMQTDKVISRETLEEAFKMYTKKDLDQGVYSSLLERSLVWCNGQNPIPTSRSSTSRGSVCWQPGRQFLKTPTFISSDACRIQSMIEVEKEVVATVCDTLQRMDGPQLPISNLILRRRQKAFMENCSAGETAASTLSAFLCARAGVNWMVKPATTNSVQVLDRSYGQMAGVLESMETWLREQSEKCDSHSRFLSRPNDHGGAASGTSIRFISSKYATPFSITNESITRQLRKTADVDIPMTAKMDPMKILCHYELNGACNDKNCSNYHRKDYDPVERNNVNQCTTGDNAAKVLKPDEIDQLLLSFAEFRGRIMKKWPVVTTPTTSTVSAGTSRNVVVTSAVMAGGGDVVEPIANDVVLCDGDSKEDDDNFVPLDMQETLPEIGDARYFDDRDARKANGDMLQTKVEESPQDTNAWLLLAIHQLGLDVVVSDEVVSFSNEDRLQQELVFLSKELNTKLCSDASRIVNVEEDNLKRCLHTLSRALEVEANAYCEALWLLYLHLCKQVTTKQTIIDMVEQAVQFLPNSHALWLRYISTYGFDSVGMAEGIHWRLLEHLANENSPEGGQNALKSNPTKKLSLLLTAICFHLCIKLLGAGATSRVLELLSAVLQSDNASSEFTWCGLVRDQLRSEELVVFHLVFAHILIAKELPKVIENWVVASSDESVPVKGMTYSFESFQTGRRDIDDDVCGRVLEVYEAAYQTFEEKCKDEHEAGNVILNNWMLVLAYHDDAYNKDKTLSVFFEEKLNVIQRYPGASLTAAKLMGLTSTDERQACQLMLAMMNESSVAAFPEALHHYLVACRQFPSLVNALDKTFSDVMKRLASLLDVDMDRIDKFIQDVMQDTSNVSKSRTLKALLDVLLTAWMDQLALLRRSDWAQPLTKSLADICVALDICCLMGLLLEPSDAIESIQTVLSSSSFCALSYEARQLAWLQRFVFQVDVLQQEVDNRSWRERQLPLTRLFRQYLAEMSVEAEMIRQVSKHIRYDIARDAVDSAVCACLYPERSHLITFDVNLELFQLCSNAIALPEKTAFYAAFTDSLALSPDFSLAFSEIACNEWELLAARASLKKCLAGTKTQHSQTLRALVAVEMRLRNMKAVSCLLESEIEADPLLLETWRLIVGLEILFGEKSEERSKSIAEEMEKRQLVLACNTYGDDKVVDEKDGSWSGALDAACLTLRGLGLESVPNAVLLRNELVSLDLSGNEFTDLPIGLRRLHHLQELDVSENALIEFPAAIRGLPKLKKLQLAHNNITTVPISGLLHLEALDIRWNAIAHLPAADLLSRTDLRTLRAEENAVPVNELSTISNLLSSRCSLDTRASEDRSREETEEASEDQARMQAVNAHLFENASAQTSEKNLSAVADVDASVSAAMDAACSTTTVKDGAIGMTQQNVDAACKSKGREDQMMTADRLLEDEGDRVTILGTGSTSEGRGKSTNALVVNESTVTNERNVSLSSAHGPSNANGNQDGETTTAANARRRQSCYNEALVARRKLSEYMERNDIECRTQVREENPTLWREFLTASLPVNVELPACRVCLTPNDGYNQRFNSIVLCVHCLEDALIVLKERKVSSE